MRRRDAPSDSRMPISRWRERPRARSRLATLAQPIIKISPKAKNSGAKTTPNPSLDNVPWRGDREARMGRPGGVCPPPPKASAGLAEARPAREGGKSARPVAHAEMAAAAASGASPGFSRPITSIGIVSSRASRNCAASARGAQ